ncbi:MAG: hypothetical protein WA979_07865 [Pacificimonas sp.]
MATAYEGASERGLDIGRVFSRTFGIIGRNIGPFAVIGVLLMLLPSAASNFLTYEAMAGADLSAVGTFQWVVYGLAIFASLLFIPAALSIAGQDAQGSVDLGTVFRTAFITFIPVIVHSILWTLGAGIGFMLIIVPGIILACMWAVSYAALVIDRHGIIGSFGRSRALTKGSRWTIFGIFVILFVAAIVISGLAAFTGPGLGVFTGAPALQNVGAIFFITSAIANTVLYVVGTTLFAAMYLELRTIRDGADTGQLGEVFA